MSGSYLSMRNEQKIAMDCSWAISSKSSSSRIEDVDHLAPPTHAREFAARARLFDRCRRDVLEPCGIGHVADEKPRQGLIRIQDDQLAAAGQLARHETFADQTRGNIRPVRDSRDDDDRLSPLQPLSGKVTDGLTVEVGILVELDDVAVLPRIRQELLPG